VKFVKKNNSFCRVSSINAVSDASIVDSSIERKVTPMGYVLQGQPNPIPLVPIGGIEEEALRLGINNTKTLLEMKLCPFLIKIGTKKNGWANKHPSRSYFGYTYNHRRLLK
jgi:hypothetical protein